MHRRDMESVYWQDSRRHIRKYDTATPHRWAMRLFSALASHVAAIDPVWSESVSAMMRPRSPLGSITGSFAGRRQPKEIVHRHRWGGVRGIVLADVADDLSLPVHRFHVPSMHRCRHRCAVIASVILGTLGSAAKSRRFFKYSKPSNVQRSHTTRITLERSSAYAQSQWERHTIAARTRASPSPPVALSSFPHGR